MGELPAASSLMSSRWSRDNLVTCHPAQLYNGRVREEIGVDALREALEDLGRRHGPVQVGTARRGVFTWDVTCADQRGPFVVQVPLVLDERGRRDRARAEVPRRNFETMRAFRARGLSRFVLEPRDFVTLAGDVPAALFEALPRHRPLTFGGGALQVELEEGERSWGVSLGPGATADLLAELVAALVYHYEPDGEGGGTALADVCFNDGDFLALRRPDGSFDVRLAATRYREGGIGPSLLLLYLVQLMAFEDFDACGSPIALPVLVSNPSVAFEGLVRGLRYRSRDLGQAEEEGARLAERWIRDFGRSRAGRSYRPWVDRFLARRLPLSFGDGSDLRERWWQLSPMHTKIAIADLRAGLGSEIERDEAAAQARTLRALVDRLSHDIGRPPDAQPGAVRINDLSRAELLSVLAEAQGPVDARGVLADDLLAHWPYRSLEDLLARVPGSRGLLALRSSLVFGRVVDAVDQGTLKSLGAPPLPRAEGDAQIGPEVIANREIFGGRSFPASLEVAAARTFPTFEAYMDAALHDERWGYYGHSVSIGQTGHFNTNPEDLSPHYGRWVAAWAFEAWQEMIARGELTEADPFPIVEFGAGNGRLARDFLDHLGRVAGSVVGRVTASSSRVPASARLPAQELASHDPESRRRWALFAERAVYRVYETSASLRGRQRDLLGTRATVTEGDARHPAETLKRDFPDGLRGFVLTNEVPDAFGVHKVILAADGGARVALLVPRVEPALREAGGERVAREIADANAAVRATFGLALNPGDFYLDQRTYRALMDAVADFAPERREALLAGGLWFEEAYVPAATVPELAAHLRANARQYATALAAEPSGVVAYVNVHASRFMRELGTALAVGYVLTVDYGETTWGLIQGARQGDFPFRVYGPWHDFQPRPNDPYAPPGTQDLTADVNFTDLAAAAHDVGLQVVHFGPERNLIGGELAEVVRAAGDDEAVAEFVGNPVFKLLLLATRPSALFSSPLLSSLPLALRDEDLAPSLRARIPAIKERLASGAVSAR